MRLTVLRQFPPTAIRFATMIARSQKLHPLVFPRLKPSNADSYSALLRKHNKGRVAIAARRISIHPGEPEIVPFARPGNVHIQPLQGLPQSGHDLSPGRLKCRKDSCQYPGHQCNGQAHCRKAERWRERNRDGLRANRKATEF